MLPRPLQDALAALCGAIATAALPPFHLIPCLIPAFCGLYLLILHADTPRRAAATGWWFGIGHFTTGLYWISNALLVDAPQFGWLVPFAMLGIPAAAAFFPAAVCAIFHLIIQPHHPAARKSSLTAFPAIALFAALWVLSEWVRNYFPFGGFPWNLIGYSLADHPPLSQFAGIAGILGLSMQALFIGLLPLPLLNRHSQPPVRLITPALILSLLGGAYSLGQERLDHAANLPATEDGTRLRLVQANILQTLKWDPNERRKHIDKHITLSRQPGLEEIDVVIWPESAVPFALNREEALQQTLAAAIPTDGHLITGGLRLEEKQGWNSLYVFNEEGRITGFYDKHHLVPFGEYIPLRHILPINRIAPGMGDFGRGAPLQELTVGKTTTFSPLICYEAIFSRYSRHQPRHPLLNVTNDAWFGHSTGPYQHLAMARIRAIEQGVPLIRAANTGISAVFNPYGQEIGRLELGREGILDVTLPSPVSPTLYAATGDTPLLRLCLTIVLIIGLIQGFFLVRARHTTPTDY